MTEPKYLTAREVAIRVSRKYNTVNDWRTKGEGPKWFKTRSGGVLYKVEDVDAWVEAEIKGE